MERITDNIAIMHGDCLDAVGAWPADAAIVTDPPYGIGYVHTGTGGGIQSRRNSKPIHGDDRPFDPSPFLRFRWVLLWGADHYKSRLPDSGSMLAWDKSCGKGPKDTFVDGEFAWCNVGGVKRNVCNYLWKGLVSVKKGEDGGRRYHPTQKPVGLCEWCLKALALPPGTLVIDPFMGVGSVGLACIRAGMRYLGVEIEKDHYEKAKWRLLRALTGENGSSGLIAGGKGRQTNETRDRRRFPSGGLWE